MTLSNYNDNPNSRIPNLDAGMRPGSVKIMTKGLPTLVKTTYGYYQYFPLPSLDDLKAYYSRKYYQEGKGSYETVYSPAETMYFKLKARLIYRKLGRLRELSARKQVLDIGCGEGWIMDCFAQEGHAVKGMDFSEYGLEAFHAHLISFMEQGECMQLIRRHLAQSREYDIIILGNVIEHVLDPVELLSIVRQILKKNGLLVIVAPNDFSSLHEYLLEHEIIDKRFWLCYPDHITYFNKDSMENLLKDKGFCVEAVVADNPVDLNLLNKNSNYINEPEKGKNVHFFRVAGDNFLASIDESKLLDLYEILGSMGVGRDLTYYCSR